MRWPTLVPERLWKSCRLLRHTKCQPPARNGAGSCRKPGDERLVTSLEYWPKMPTRRVAAIVLAVLAFPAVAAAQADEIQVYDGGLAAKGTVNLTWHNNFIAKGLTSPAFPGAVAPNRSVNGVTEWALG